MWATVPASRYRIVRWPGICHCPRDSPSLPRSRAKSRRGRNDFAVLIPRILLVPRLKGKWSVYEIEIQIVESEPVQTRLESRFDPLGPMIGVPQLCGNKHLFTCNPSGGEPCLQSFAHLTLVPISFCTIKVSKSCFQCVPGTTYRRGCIGNQGAKAEYGYMAGSVA